MGYAADNLELGTTMTVKQAKRTSTIEDVLVEEAYSEGRVIATVAMRRDAETGQLSYTPSALRTLDRLRAVLQELDMTSSPGHICSLRDALGLTQQQFAQRLKVASQTVSRWERGEIRPGTTAIERLRRLQKTIRAKGIAIKER